MQDRLVKQHTVVMFDHITSHKRTLLAISLSKFEADSVRCWECPVRFRSPIGLSLRKPKMQLRAPGYVGTCRTEGSDHVTLVHQKAWEPSVYYTTAKEIYYYAGHEISIWESQDSYGAIVWPAALALCQYLDTNRGTVNLLDKTVLEIGAGTGLVSIVASLLGAWVTAGDLPDVMSNLRRNLSRNTRCHCRYTPQVVELSWGYEMEQSFPRSSNRYDYVLAADVVYHHDFLAELFVTMRHFCQPGTTIIWANKIRFGSDLVFIENFKNGFHTVLLADMGEVKIYSATTKDFDEEKIPVMISEETPEQKQKNSKERGTDFEEGDISVIFKDKKRDQNPEEAELKSQCRAEECQMEGEMSEKSKNIKEEEYEEWKLDENAPAEDNPLAGRNEETSWAKNKYAEGSGGTNDMNCQAQEKIKDGVGIQNCTESSTETDVVKKFECIDSESNAQLVFQRTWVPSVYYKLQKEIHYFMGHKISIEESIDSYGGMIWPAAVALCKFLETPAGQQQIHLLDRETLELGAGTGLLSIVATLLGAKLTATDLPEILGNLRCNLNRNTRGHRKHEPRVAALSWGHDLEETFPLSEYHYDYVLAADVVYHHDYLAELLDTMRYFCQPGTNLIWANKVRYPSDLVFIENFQKAFHHTLIAELDEVKIYLATYREADEEDRCLKGINKEEDIYRNEETRNYTQQSEVGKVPRKEEYTEVRPGSDGDGNTVDKHQTGEETQTEPDCNNSWRKWKIKADAQERHTEEPVMQQNKLNEGHCIKEGKYIGEKETELENVERDKDSPGFSESKLTSSARTEQRALECLEKNGQVANQRTWEPSVYYIPGKEIHYFMDHRISIEESYDSYGATIWPAAIALCKFLETPAGQQHINLFDKSVLEIGAGPGLVSAVATLLGAKLTATDLPEILSNLRCNLNRNTRWLRRHEPQVRELSWGHRLEETFPHAIYYYDYVLATDVVYHHDFLAELLDTMHHFCQPGTSLIWANKIRYPSDLVFIENFKKMFHTTLIAELDEVKIYRATHKPSEENTVISWRKKEEEEETEHNGPEVWKRQKAKYSPELWGNNHTRCKGNEVKKQVITETKEEGKKRSKRRERNNMDSTREEEVKNKEKEKISKEEGADRGEERRTNTKDTNEGRDEEVVISTRTKKDYHHEELQDSNKPQPVTGETEKSETDKEFNCQRVWCKLNRDIHYFVNHEITIDSYEATIWPATLVLCRFLETAAQHMKLLDKSVLELGSATGLVSIVAALLGARVTATDQPEVLGCLRNNLNQNTKCNLRYKPQVEGLCWGRKLEETFPTSTHHYDYILAADVVYYHDFLDELLVTMRHFCQSGTTLIWANKVRYPSDLVFTENFQKAFNTSLIADADEVKIYSATCKGGVGKDPEVATNEEMKHMMKEGYTKP